MVREVEALTKDAGYKVVTVDAHRNVRVREKLGIKELPTVVELAKGNKIRTAPAASASDVKAFCDECFG